MAPPNRTRTSVHFVSTKTQSMFHRILSAAARRTGGAPRRAFSSAGGRQTSSKSTKTASHHSKNPTFAELAVAGSVATVGVALLGASDLAHAESPDHIHPMVRTYLFPLSVPPPLPDATPVLAALALPRRRIHGPREKRARRGARRESERARERERENERPRDQRNHALLFSPLSRE
jgi:hypothetical protein